MDHSRTLLKQTDDELLFCIQNLPLEAKWKNIILSQEEGFYSVDIELYDSLEGCSRYEKVGRFSNFENAEDVFKKERLSLIFSLIDEKIIEIDDSGDFVLHGAISSELVVKLS